MLYKSQRIQFRCRVRAVTTLTRAAWTVASAQMQDVDERDGEHEERGE